MNIAITTIESFWSYHQHPCIFKYHHDHHITNLNSDISEPAPSKHLPQASLASWSKLPLLGSIASRTQEEPMIRGEFKSSSEEAAKLMMLESRRKVRWNSILMLKSPLNKTGPIKANQPLIYSQSTWQSCKIYSSANIIFYFVIFYTLRFLHFTPAAQLVLVTNIYVSTMADMSENDTCTLKGFLKTYLLGGQMVYIY